MSAVVRRLVKHYTLWALSLFFRDDGPKVVYYHDVGTVYTDMGTPLELLKAHVLCARQMGFSFVSKLKDLAAPKKLLMCFDDGFRGLWDEREYFFQEGVCPTVFIAVDMVGQKGYLTWDEIRELQSHGFVFQSHTWSHRPLTDVPDEELPHELADARVAIGRELGNSPDMLCFPCGMHSQKVVNAAKKAGYKKLFASYPGCVDLDDAVVPRNLVQNMSVADFKNVLHGALCPLKTRYMRQHWKS